MFESLTEQPGSGARTGLNTYEYVYKGTRSEVESAFADLVGASENGSTVNGKAVLIDSCRVQHDAGFSTLFVCATDSSTATFPSITHSEGEHAFSLEVSHMELPLEEKSGYRTWWNYDLFKSYKETDTYSYSDLISQNATAKTMTTTDYPRNTMREVLRWAKEPPAPYTYQGEKYVWIMALARKHPGTEFFYFACPTVVEQIYFGSKSKAIANIGTANTCRTPGETFGYDRTARCWLCQPDGIREAESYYATVNRYLFAPGGWKEDFYA